MNTLPLHNFHEERGAEFIEKYQKKIPRHYGNSADELLVAYNKIAVIDHSYFGKIKLHGPDALDLINRISTNDMKQLIIGSVCDTVFVSPKGRIIDFARVLRYDDHLILVCRNTEAGQLMDWINRFIFLEDVRLEDVSDQYLWLTVMGPESLRFLRSLSGQRVVEKDEQIWINHDDLQFPALLNSNYMVPAYNFCVPSETSQGVAVWLDEELERYGGLFMGDDAFQVMRIKSGTPAWGNELNDRYNPHEARLLNAVSFTKECYTGQEVIARLDTYDKVQRHLMVLTMDQRPNGPLPLEICCDSEPIGMLTSITDDPVNRKCVGLAYIKKNYAVAAMDIQVDVMCDENPITATISLPPSGDYNRT